MLRSALLILSSNVVGSVLGLARSLLVARLIPLGDFGIAATFSLAMSVIEMMSSLGLGQQIVQAKDGDDPRLQAALQGFQVLRGIVNGAILFALAGPLADFMNVPQAAWGYRLMALVPVLSAFGHFDVARLNRQMIFGPGILAGFVPALAGVLLIWPLSLLFGDWRTMLFVILAQSVLGLLMSHLVARRPYRLALDKGIVKRALNFGWPLLLNNVLLFLVFNGDRVIVGRVLGMEALAIFSMGVSLTLAPTLVLAKTVQTLFLPQLSRPDRTTPEGEARFRYLLTVVIEAALLNGLLMVLGTVLLGGLAVHLLLGPKYAALIPLLPTLAVLHGLRVFKSGPSVAALARGRTGNAMAGNLPRLAAVALAWVVLEQGGGLQTVIWIGIAAELCGFAISLLLLSRRTGASLRPAAPAIAAALLYLAVIGAMAVPGLGAPAWADDAAAVGLLPVLFVAMRALRGYARRRLLGRAGGSANGDGA